MTTHLIAPTDLPEALRRAIEESAEAANAEGDLTSSIHNMLRDTGAFRLLTPAEYSGSETELSTALDVYEKFGYIDASAGLIVWNRNFGFIGALLSEAGAARIWVDGTEPIFANAGSPVMLEQVEGGYRLSADWRIVSGINNADWLIALGVVAENGVPRLTGDGRPDARLCAIHRDQLRINRTWDVTAVRASGSDGVTVDSVLVPDDLAASLYHPARIGRPLYRGFIPALVLPGSAAVAIGVTRRAIDEMAELAVSKAAQLGGTLAESNRAQYAIARSEAAVQSSRLLLHRAVQTLESRSHRGETATVEQRAALLGAISYAGEVCRDALQAMYALAGSSALYRENRVERVLRDGMAVVAHANNSPLFLEAAGRVRLGLDMGLPLF